MADHDCLDRERAPENYVPTRRRQNLWAVPLDTVKDHVARVLTLRSPRQMLDAVVMLTGVQMADLTLLRARRVAKECEEDGALNLGLLSRAFVRP